ncbi:MAG: hypothetical protein AAGF24_11880 [Cyanobacteria bacterium P01_H01_bin.121]
MLGGFQTSKIRIEVEATAEVLQRTLLSPECFRQWCYPQRFETGLPDRLTAGMHYSSWLGPLTIRHRVMTTQAGQLVVLLSEGIDGCHEFVWGDGWVQSSLEGISLLPLNLAQTYTLLQLRRFLQDAS